MPRLRSLIPIIAGGALLTGGGPSRDPVADPHSIVHGMTVSCQSWGWEWGSDAMLETMDELKSLGVNWIAIHPYAGIRQDGTVGVRRDFKDAVWLHRPIEEAHKRGLKIIIKPHIAYWGSGFSWPGEIAFETEDQWQRFFSTYQAWIERLAQETAGADAFCVGTELDRTIDHAVEWRQIISALRTRSSAIMTYGANWDSYERVSFWDALDVVCVHAYFPLTDQTDVPRQDQLDAAWKQWISKLEAFGQGCNRKVVLGELGYDCSMTAAIRPWEASGPHGRAHPPPTPEVVVEAAELQRRCLTAALSAIDESDVVVGAFLWKWFPGGPEASRGEDFLMSTPAMREVISTSWNRR